jgi:hypothetical protein
MLYASTFGAQKWVSSTMLKSKSSSVGKDRASSVYLTKYLTCIKIICRGDIENFEFIFMQISFVFGPSD